MTKSFSGFAKRHRIRDRRLCIAVREVVSGRTTADLGGGVIKLRLSRAGEGRSGGLRSIVLFRVGDRAIQAYGYAKSDRDDIEPDELRAFRALARVMLALDHEGLDHEGLDRAGFSRAGFNRAGFNRAGFNRAGFNRAMDNGTIREINCDG